MKTKRPTRHGLGGVYQRGGVWWIRFSVEGVKRRESSKSANRRVAVELLKTRQAAIASHTFAPMAGKVTLGDLRALIAADYELSERRSGERVERAFKHLFGFFGENARAVSVTGDRLMAYAADRQQAAKPATVKYELATLRRGFTLARTVGRLNIVPPFPSITVHNTRHGFVSAEQREEIISKLPEDVRPVVEFLALTGWRKGEALNLAWRHVNESAGVIVLGLTKSGEPRLLPYARSERLKAIIEARAKRRDELAKAGKITPHVFTRDGGSPIRTIHEAWKRATRAAGLPGRLLHDLRRSFARDMSNAGVGQQVIMALAGWETPEIFKRYRIVVEQDMGDALAKLNNGTRDAGTNVQEDRG